DGFGGGIPRHRHTVHGLRRPWPGTLADFDDAPEPDADRFRQGAGLGHGLFYRILAGFGHCRLGIVIGEDDLAALVDAELDRAIEDRAELGQVADPDSQRIGHLIADHRWWLGNAVLRLAVAVLRMDGEIAGLRIAVGNALRIQCGHDGCHRRTVVRDGDLSRPRIAHHGKGEDRHVRGDRSLAFTGDTDHRLAQARAFPWRR